MTGNKVLERRVNWGVLNGCRGYQRGTLTRPVHSLRGSERKECEDAEQKAGGECVCVYVYVCAHTLSLAHLVLVGSVGLQSRTVAEGDTKAHSICFGHRWNLE